MNIATPKEYVATGGSQCPVCKSTEIEGADNVVTAGTEASQHIRCTDCCATWHDQWDLVGYTDLQLPT